ncbi:MAG: AAA family ATPase [Pelagibacterium sp.]|uniref:AAA family ATPase n=1 Tax=Pelagibacterium sp. TaxID=1967288 RepID=UPI0032EE8696
MLDANDIDPDDDAPPAPDNPRFTDILAQETLTRALSPRAHSLLARGSALIIVKSLDHDWTELLVDGLLKLSQKAVILTVPSSRTSRIRAGGPEQGSEALDHLKRGRRVILVSHDPEGMVDEKALAAADLTIEIPQLTVALLRTVLRQLKTGSVRGITDEMVRIPLPVIESAIRPGLSLQSCIANLRRALARGKTSAGPRIPSLSTLPLTPSVQAWADQTVKDLVAVRSGSLPHQAVPFGLLQGPPGTGKTLLAQSIAHAADYSFVTTSVGSWFASGDGALGGVTKNMREFFSELASKAPVIGLIDEIDALPNRATMESRGRDWWTPIITQVLLEIDSLRASEKNIFLIGATNHPSMLDAALVRPGRLQQKISVVPPSSAEEALALLKFFLKDDALDDVGLAQLSRLGLGATPAVVEGWVKQARAEARAAGRSLTIRDIRAQIVPRDDRNADDIRAIAIHEVGHALVGYRLGQAVESVSVIPEGRQGGHAQIRHRTIVHTLDTVHDLVTMLLGGRAADIVLGKGPNTGAASDLEAATRMMLAAHHEQGMGKSLVYLPAVTSQPEPATQKAVARELHALLDRAIDIIEKDRSAALRLVDRLTEASVLTEKDIADILGPGRVSTDRKLLGA